MIDPLKLLSVGACVLILVAVAFRRRRRIHVPLILSAFTIDLGLVVYLEIMRGVVESIPSRPMSALLLVHIIVSTVVLVLYAVQIKTGLKNLRGGRSRVHRNAGIAFIIVRLTNLVTSFYVS